LFIKPAIRDRGKGNQEREIALEKRGVQALKNYLAVRPENLSDVLFLNYKGEPISLPFAQIWRQIPDCVKL
jgi:site-specific recombinase XerC